MQGTLNPPVVSSAFEGSNPAQEKKIIIFIFIAFLLYCAYDYLVQIFPN